MGFPRQEYWSALPSPSPGDLPNPGFESGSPVLQADSLLSEPPGKPSYNIGQDKLKIYIYIYVYIYISNAYVLLVIKFWFLFFIFI